ncbi:putative disease resistance protein RGA4 [Carex rostrata]
MEFLLSKLDTRVTSAKEVKNDLDRLINTLPRVNILMDKAEWWRFNDQHVAHFLKQLRDAAYDAEDVIAEFKYYELQQQIEGKANRRLLSLLTFIKDLVSNSTSKVKDIQGRLDFVTAELERATDLFGSSNGSTPHETTSFVTESMLGREKEVEVVLQLMQESGDLAGSSNSAKRRKTAGNLLILPIVGIGGVGKTTLAQQIYNNERVKNHFDLRIWVCVSDRFDLKKKTKEMIESANRELRNKESEFDINDNLTNLDSLQHTLKGKVQSRRYLVVLDDVWHENSRDLESLYNPLRSGLRGSMILVTTCLSKVAEIVGTHDPIELGGLPDNIYWDLFKKCAFGSLDPSSFPELEDIGLKIAVKLEGSPLAAKTLGGILRANMTTRQWTNILNSELWQIEQADGDILPALRVSYRYLPLHLKQCFSIFSLFPKYYPLYLNFLSPIWLADGLFSREERIFLEEEKGHWYFQEFKNRSFIVRGEDNNTYLHDLMHDLAKSVSLDICYCQEEDEWSLQNHDTVRHLSVYRKQIELIDNEISKCKKLRSLLFIDGLNYETKLDSSSLRYLFNELPYL